MGLPSLREDIEEAQRLAKLTESGIATLAISESSAAEVHRQERIVQGLLKRCAYMVATLDDLRISAGEVPGEVGNHAYLVRASLERAGERVAELEAHRAQLLARIAALEVRVRLASKLTEDTSSQKNRAKKEKKKASLRTVRPPKAEIKKPDPKAALTPKLTKGGRTAKWLGRPRVVDSVKQAFSHGRTKAVVVERLIPRGRSAAESAKIKPKAGRGGAAEK